MDNKRIYHCYMGMKQRCYNPNNKRYVRYGGRGITICERWLKSFKNFVEDMGEMPIGLQIDRINNDGNYEPSNCKWSTAKEQANNRSINGRPIKYPGVHASLTSYNRGCRCIECKAVYSVYSKKRPKRKKLIKPQSPED